MSKIDYSGNWKKSANMKGIIKTAELELVALRKRTFRNEGDLSKAKRVLGRALVTIGRFDRAKAAELQQDLDALDNLTALEDRADHLALLIQKHLLK